MYSPYLRNEGFVNQKFRRYIGLGIPLLLGRIPPNSWYGCRTPKTLSSSLSSRDSMKIDAKSPALN
jgi:hypothetical protein